MNNNTLIVFLNDGRKLILSFSLEITEEEALSEFKALHEEERTNVKKYFYIENDTVSVDVYQNYYELDENQQLTMDIRTAFIEKKVEEIRKERNILVSNLDIPFWKALESRDEELQDHIASLKNFLRDVTENLRFDEIEKNANIANYDPFGNLFEVVLVESGNGYEKPPQVTIDPPRNKGTFGFQAKAVASIKGLKVVEIKVIDHGCGYDFVPKVTVEAPSGKGKPALAACTFPHNTLLTQDMIVENSRKHYYS